GPARNRHYARYAKADFQDMPIEPVADDVLRRITGPWVTLEAMDFEIGARDAWNSFLYAAIRMQGDRESYANFLSQNTIVDDGVGRVLETLRRKGLLENTLIVYSADQGNHFGQHGIWGHSNFFEPTRLYDTATRIPLIVRSPDRETAGRVDETMIGQYDLMPTLLAALGASGHADPRSPGRDFSPLFRNETLAKWGEAVFFEQEETRGIRTPDHLYWQRHPELGRNALFDLRTDPGQRRDVADDPAYAKARKNLDRQVTAFFEHNSDARFDLWKGGEVKGLALSPWKWKKVHGEQWGQPSSQPAEN
ncbi:unnamed protein product, partial [marine sediment metagenome]